MKIELLNRDAKEREAFQRFVEKHGLTFHSHAWLQNFDPLRIKQCVLKNKNNEVVGCFLYYRFRKFGFEFVITPPYTPSIELFYVNPSESVVSKVSFDKETMKAVGEYFASLKVSYAGVYFPTTVVDTQPLIWQGFSSHVRYTYQVDLTRPEEELLANLSSEKRKSLNKAEKDGLVVKETKDFESVEALVLKSLGRNQVDTNVQIIHQILRQFSKGHACTAFIASQGNIPIGTAVCVKDKDRAIYLFGGFDDVNKNHGAGVACMWQLMLSAKKQGLRVFDFEGSMHPGIERYYREFGGRLTPYYKAEKAGVIVKTLMRLKGVNN